MQAYEHAPDAVNAAHDRQGLEAVQELRADWLADRPEHCCCPAAKADPCTSCNRYGPPPSDFTITDLDDLHEGPYSSPLFDVVALLEREEAEEEVAAHLAGREPVAGYDDVWEPSEADQKWVVDNPTLQATLARAADLFADSENPHLRAIGEHLGRKYDDARRVEATSWEQMEDRLDAERDALTCR